LIWIKAAQLISIEARFARIIKERAKPMISLEDCIGMCGLNANEVAAIGEHEHIPDIAAAALADYLLKQAGGPQRIRMMIVEDIHKALDAGHIRHAAELFMALRHFLKQHPEAMRVAGGIDGERGQCESGSPDGVAKHIDPPFW
jgi:hypothetical protein